MPVPPAAPRSARRVRLSPAERIPAVLDVALQEFAQQGFMAARMEDIATRAGLSKGGLYAHFSSKEALFGELLRRELSAPAMDVEAILDHAGTLPEVVDQLVALLGQYLLRPSSLTMLRLLLAEGHRVPEITRQWSEQTIDATVAGVRALLERCLAQGLCRDSVLCRNPQLVLSPFIHAMVQQLVPGQPGRTDVALLQSELRALLLESLEPAPGRT